MASTRAYMVSHMALAALALVLAPYILVATADDTVPIPENLADVPKWFEQNVKPGDGRKAELDPPLAGAEDGPPTVIKVMQDGSGQFKTLTEALNSVPVDNKKRVIISIGPGEYKEKITIPRPKPFVTFYGADPGNMPRIVFGGTAKQYGTDDSATFIILTDYFMAVNIIFANSAPRPTQAGGKGQQAVAMRVDGDKAAFYNCKFFGFQDTICDDHFRHFYKDCHIEGTVDFIFGTGKSMFLSCNLNTLGEDDQAFITAQARAEPSEDTGFSFVHCTVTGKGKLNYLGRSWMPCPRVAFAYTQMDSILHAEGWSSNNHPEFEKTVSFFEYKNSGPGADPASRPSFVKQLSDADAKTYLSLSFVEGSKWLLPPPKL